MSTAFSYNGVSLSHINTADIDDVPEFDESGTDYLHTRRTITLNFVIHAGIVPAAGAETAQAVFNRIRHLLEVPRKTMIYTVGGVEIFRSPSTGQTKDAKNGPFPRGLKVLKVLSSTSYLCQYTIETYVIECAGGGSTPVYTSHRWTDAVDMDERFFSTRTRSGIIHVRANANINPDTLRHLSVQESGKVPNGFIRTRSHYGLGADGLSLSYEFIDREQYLMPPAPAVKASGWYAESSPQGTIRFRECSVRLEGAKVGIGGGGQFNKAELLRRAVLIAVTKVGLNDRNQKVVLKAAAIKEELWDNIVEVSIRVLVDAAEQRPAGGMPIDLSRFVRPPVGSEAGTLPPEGGLRGSASLLLVAASLKDPCLAVAEQAVARGEPRAVGTDGLPEPTVSVDPPPPEQNSGPYNRNRYDGVYTKTDGEGTLTWDFGIEFVPIAGPEDEDEAVELGGNFKSVEPVQVRRPQARRKVKFDNRGIGGSPPMPKPVPRRTDKELPETAKIRERSPQPTGEENLKERSRSGEYDMVIIFPGEYSPLSPPAAPNLSDGELPRGTRESEWYELYPPESEGETPRSFFEVPRDRAGS